MNTKQRFSLSGPMHGHGFSRREGTTMILVVVLATALLALTVVSVQGVLARTTTRRSQRAILEAQAIADSAASQALARTREGGVLTPHSGTGANPGWVAFAGGHCLYYTVYDATSRVSVVRAWGRIAVDDSPANDTVPPDDVSFNGAGWVVRGVELSLQSFVYLPPTPIYFGNGGIERPLGGFEMSGGGDPNDPSTWQSVTGSPSSYQAASVPFEASALDHPMDYIYGGGTPTPATGYPHPYQIFASQTLIGQHNIEAWFTGSAGAGNDPTTGVTPPPTSSYFDVSDSNSPNYPYPLVPNIMDVQDYAWSLWSQHVSDPSVTKLGTGAHSGVYGDLATPEVTFVTGTLRVDPGQTFRGAGVLVIRDDFDPNVDTNNTPANRAILDVLGTFEWTGLVIIAGWAPTVRVQAGGDATVVGMLMGEDSVQSGGEVSLDSATIVFNVDDSLRILYSNGLFNPSGPVYPLLPAVAKELVATRDI